MLATVSKWGNSRALRIPKQLAMETGLDFGSKVELVLEDGQLRIVPVKEPRYTLEELVAQITPENRHGEVDIGPAVGKEVWW
ncbi:MAG: AbrB/MazE/SpoVT family DNA-binding domain-containing protein [Chloroflexi bacterium]|nr:AbrB/MazE/SpoVT family DNA-binding domain-containing protein [Chloroflexota bacterium]